MNINIIFPVLNEQLRLENGIMNTMQFLDRIENLSYQLTIIDNGSADHTQDIGERLSKQYPQVEYVRLNERGVGLAFREGVKQNSFDIIGYMDIDLSTDIRHLGQVIKLYQKKRCVDIINGSRWNKASKIYGRKWYRILTSRGLAFLLKLFLQMKATDAICGFKFFRKNVIDELMAESSNENGWDYIIELLIRAERKKYNIIELPVKWTDDYNTKVKVLKQILKYLKHIKRLFIEFNIKKHY